MSVEALILSYGETQRMCSVTDCDHPLLSRGLCNMHYIRLRASGPLPPLPPRVKRSSEAVSAYQRAWRAAHPDYRREKSREWRAANVTRKRQTDAARRDANRERIREQHRSWMKANPDRVRDNTARQRARRKPVLLVGRVSRLAVWQRDGGLCGVCGQRADRRDWHLDHVIPVVRGGPHSMENVQVTHPSCNQRKGAKWKP